MTLDDNIFSVSGGKLTLKKDQKLHITRVEVFTGDDEYLETDCIEVTASQEKLRIKKYLEHLVPVTMRIRSELGMRVYFSSENGNNYYFQMGHHKGSVAFELFEFNRQNDVQAWDQVI